MAGLCFGFNDLNKQKKTRKTPCDSTMMKRSSNTENVSSKRLIRIAHTAEIFLFRPKKKKNCLISGNPTGPTFLGPLNCFGTSENFSSIYRVF